MNKIFVFLVFVAVVTSSCISNRYLLSGDTDNRMLKELIRTSTKNGVISKKPIVVVDGRPLRYADLKQIPLWFKSEEVKSVEILKKESAVKIYGSDGKNGCMLITTFEGYGNRVKILKDKTIFIVFDGKEISNEMLEKINPDTIDTIEVIKDVEEI